MRYHKVYNVKLTLLFEAGSLKDLHERLQETVESVREHAHPVDAEVVQETHLHVYDYVGEEFNSRTGKTKLGRMVKRKP